MDCTIEKIVELSTFARLNGMPALEKQAAEIEDPFLQQVVLRLENELICGKAEEQVRLLRLTLEGILMLQENKVPQAIKETLESCYCNAQ
jgi:flagellar motor component MotA